MYHLNDTETHSVEYVEYTEFINEYIPVFVYLLFLGIVGTFGNLHVILVYLKRYKPSNHRMFILWLASVDLFSCTVSIPFEMYDIRYRYTFTASWACKIFRFVNHAASLASGFLLGLIALERFRKACQPMQTQMTIKQSKLACIATLLVSFLLGIPSVIIYGANVSETMHPGIMGSDCTSLTKFKSFFKVYSGLLLLFATAVFVMCTIIYIFVGRVLYRQMKQRKNREQRRTKLYTLSMCASNLSPAKANVIVGSTVSLDKHVNIMGSTATLNKIEIEDEASSYNNEHLRVNISKTSEVQKRRIKINRSKRITLMFLVATSVSYLGYLPNTVISVIKALDTDTFSELSVRLGAAVFILLRLYFISNVTNPIVYSFMDERFREECKDFYKKVYGYATKCYKKPITV